MRIDSTRILARARSLADIREQRAQGHPARSGGEPSYGTRFASESVDATPAGGFAPRFGMSQGPQQGLRAPGAAQVAHHGRRKLAGISVGFATVRKALEEVGDRKTEQGPHN